MKRIISILAIAAAAVTCASAQTSEYTPGVNQEGVTYCLPETRLNITVTAVKTTYSPGEFSKYAERYLRISDIREQASESWEISSMDMNVTGIPDKDHMYTVKFDKKSIAPYVELTQDGILSALNTQAPPVAKLDAGKTDATKKADAIKKDPKSLLTEEILMAGSTAKMAELTAKEIFSIRESRNAITRGQADYLPSDGESVKYVLEQLDEQERLLTTLFTGTTETESHSYTIAVTPRGDVKKQLLMRLSNKLGVVDVENLAGSPVYIDITDLKAAAQPPLVTDKKKSEPKGTGIIWYRIPGKAQVKIYDGSKTYYEASVSIAQFGNVEILSGTLMSKASATEIIFDTATGGVRSVTE